MNYLFNVILPMAIFYLTILNIIEENIGLKMQLSNKINEYPYLGSTKTYPQ